MLSRSDLFRLGFIMSRNTRNDRGKRTWAQVVSRGVEGKSRPRRRSQPCLIAAHDMGQAL